MKISHRVNITKKPFHLFHRRRTVGQAYGNFHAHPGMEFLFIQHGFGQIVMNQHSYPVEPGTIFFFQPFQPHQLKIEPDDSIGYLRSIIIFDAYFLKKKLDSFPALQCFFLELWKGRLDQPLFRVDNQREALAQLYDHLDRKLLTRPPEKHVEIYTAFMIALLQLLEPHHTIHGIQKSIAQPRGQHYAEIMMQWIDNHLSEPFALEELAAHIHLTAPHTSRLFRSATGTTITDYLTSRRLEEACLLLQSTQLSVEEVGIRVGMPNASHFCTLFRKKMGVTPARFRKIYYEPL
jgi:AraC family transcriptional regulator, arabinose operon regulatory protein